MRYAYADPPYLGCCGLYDHNHPDGRCWDDPETHRLLIERLSDEYPDGWALSLHEPSLRTIHAMCPDDVRVGAWVKPFAVFKKGVNPAWTWEPVMFRGGRRRTDGAEPTVADFCIAGITLKRGTKGAKPDKFTWWVLAMLGVQAADEFHDLFPGSGAVGRAWEAWRSQLSLGLGGAA